MPLDTGHRWGTTRRTPGRAEVTRRAPPVVAGLWSNDRPPCPVALRVALHRSI